MQYPFRLPLGALCVLAGFFCVAGNAHAAQSYDACQGQFIDSLPVTISTQGVWCLRKDLTTGITMGGAITIATNNVTIDCNDFKIGGLSAGAMTFASGVASMDHSNVTVRNCTIRGFYAGVALEGNSRAKTGGHVVENNRLTDNTRYGIYVEGDGSVIERNKVLDTGGSTAVLGAAVAITGGYDVDVIDNLVSNVAASPNGSGDVVSYGIQVLNNTGTVSGNRVRNLLSQGAGGMALGIFSYNSLSERTSIRGNDVVGSGAGYGVYCDHAQAVAQGNTVGGFPTAVQTCTASGNAVGP